MKTPLCTSNAQSKAARSGPSYGTSKSNFSITFSWSASSLAVPCSNKTIGSRNWKYYSQRLRRPLIAIYFNSLTETSKKSKTVCSCIVLEAMARDRWVGSRSRRCSLSWNSSTARPSSRRKSAYHRANSIGTGTKRPFK